MSSADKVNIMVAQKLGDNIGPKYEANTSLILCPSCYSLFRVSPQQITQQSLVWDLNRSDNLQNLLKIIKLRTQTSMHAKDLLINQRSDRHYIENIREYFPQFQIIFPFTQIFGMFYTHHKSHKFYQCLSIHGYHAIERSFMGILFYKRVVGKYTQQIVFLYRCNLPKINNWHLLGNLHTRIVQSDLRTGHEHHHIF